MAAPNSDHVSGAAFVILLAFISFAAYKIGAGKQATNTAAACDTYNKIELRGEWYSCEKLKEHKNEN